MAAVVELKSGDRGRYTETDDKGRFVFDGLPAGDFTVNAYAPGFPAETRQLAGPKTVRLEKRACATQVLVAPPTRQNESQVQVFGRTNAPFAADLLF